MKRGEFIGMESESDAGEAGSKIIDYWIFFIFLIPLILVLIYAIVSFVNASLYVDPAVEHELAAERVMNCFAVRDDEVARQYPPLDLSRMTEENLATCFSLPKQGVRVILEDAGTHEPLVDIKAYTADLPVRRKAYQVIYRDAYWNVKEGVLDIDLS